MTGAGAASLRSVLIAATTWWPAPARLAGAFASLDIDIAAICPAGHPLRKVQSVSRLLHYRPLRPVACLRAAIERCRPDLVVACDDRVVEHCVALHAAGDASMRALIRRSLASPEAYPVIASRSALLRLARAEDLRVPPSVAVSNEGEADRLRFPLPWVVKSSGSWGGAGVRIVDTAAEAKRAIAALRRPLGVVRAAKRLMVNRDGFWIESWRRHAPHEVVVQAHVEGVPANIAVACHEGKVLSSIAVRALRTQGRTGPASVAEVIDNREMLSAAQTLARRLGLSGFHGLDFILDRNGAEWLLELNPRATQLCHFAANGRRSLAEALVRHRRGDPRPATEPAVPGTRIAFFPQAWRAEPKDPLLHSDAHDVPWEEPALVTELMAPPWPNRGLLARAWQHLSGAGDANAAWAGAAPVATDVEAPAAAISEPARPPARPALSERIL